MWNPTSDPASAGDRSVRSHPGRDRPTLGRRPSLIGTVAIPQMSWRVYLPPLLVGLGVRLSFALIATQPTLPNGVDQFYYRGQAELLTHGYWWVMPGSVVNGGPGVPGAQHPPLFSAILAVADLIGLHGSNQQRAFLCILSVAAVVCCGRIGARLAGRTGQLAAAWAAAVLPGMWIYNGEVLSETVTVPLVAAAVLALYRMWERPTRGRAAVLGVSISLCALTRPELLALVVIFVPLWRAGRPRRAGMALTGVFLIAVAVIVGPWVGHNLHDYRDPELISVNFGSVIVGANCNLTYSGPLLGAWDSRCATTHLPPGDASTVDNYYRAVGERYAREHLGRVPTVIAARVGRSLGVWPSPAKAVSWDAKAGGIWPRWSAWLYLTTWLLSIPVVVMAVVSLRRRGVAAWPLYSLVALFLVVSALLCDNPRYASSCQPALAILVGLGLATMISALKRWRFSRDARFRTTSGDRTSDSGFLE